MGYVNNFDVEGDRMICIESGLGVPVAEILVDDVYEYADEGFTATFRISQFISISN